MLMTAKTLIKRIDSKCFKNQNGCLIWTGALNQNGYGVIWIDGINRYAHRINYTLRVSEIPLGMNLLHSCDVPACIEPSHLRIGTQKENVHDTVKRGRVAKGFALPQTKLATKDRIKIKDLYRSGQFTQKALAKIFGVHQMTISNSLRGKYGK